MISSIAFLLISSQRAPAQLEPVRQAFSSRVQKAKAKADLSWLKGEAIAAAKQFQLKRDGPSLYKLLLAQWSCKAFLGERPVRYWDFMDPTNRELALLVGKSDEALTARQLAVLELGTANTDGRNYDVAPSKALRSDIALASACATFILLVRLGPTGEYDLAIERSEEVAKKWAFMEGPAMIARQQAYFSSYTYGGPVEHGPQSLVLSKELRRKFVNNQQLIRSLDMSDRSVRARLKGDSRFKGKLP